MNSIEIRDVKATDIPAIKAVIAAAWDWVSLIKDEKTLNSAISIYLHQVLHEATFGRVAVLDDKVAGVIFGSIDGAAPEYRALMEDAAAHAVTLLGASKNDRENIYEYLSNVKLTYEHLVRDFIDNYDGTLDFLVLAKEAQGSGTGKNLWMALKSYFEENNVTSIYLYSDTECNFGFYEHNGFTKRAEQNVTFTFSGEEFKTSIFLYDIQLQKGGEKIYGYADTTLQETH